MRFSIFSVADHYPEEPRTIRELYAQILDEIELADELGFSAFFLAEHHFHEYGLVPSPPTLLGAAAERTKRIGLGVAVSVLPFHQPLVAAEEYAMLDQMTGGRLVLGVGSGYLKHEFEGFYLAPWEKRARFDEALKRYVRSRLYAKRRSYDELETAGLILFGDAEQVTSRIRELEAAGMNHLMILVDFGALQAERVRASLNRFVREVMPNFVESGSIRAS